MDAYHVLPNHNGGWDVKRDRAERATRHFENKNDAIRAARELSKTNETELVIHDKEGRIIAKDSHGRDPFPPKG